MINRLTKYNQMALFSYSTKHLQKSGKIRFFYALTGRDYNYKGILERTGTQRLGRCVLIVPQDHAKEIEDFLTFWKCEFVERLAYIERE